MKDFFKFTKVKLLLTLLLPFYFAIAVQTIFGPNATVASKYFIDIKWIPFVLLIFGTMYIWSATDRYFFDFSLLSGSQKIFFVLSETLLPLIINYILVCLLVYLYNYLKKKRKSASLPKRASP